MVGLTRIELVTSSLSGTRSNQLSYKPIVSLYLWKRHGTKRFARNPGFTLGPCFRPLSP